MKPLPFANPRLWTFGAVAALIALVIALNVNKSPKITGGINETTPVAGVQGFTALTKDHKSGDIAYPDAPPVGGDHSAIWQNCGIYKTQIKLEQAVHSLEHGAVWITYKPDLDPAQVLRLRDLGRGNPNVLVAPYSFGGLDQPVAILVWGYRLILSGAEDARIAEFIKAYAKNPKGPEPGAPCTGGDGTPNA